MAKICRSFRCHNHSVVTPAARTNWGDIKGVPAYPITMNLHTATCRCGAVELELAGSPFLTTACVCNSCRAAAACFASLPGSTSLLDDCGATATSAFRKDRIRCVRGSEFLREHRLNPKTTTRRVVATCCNAPMFMEFTKGHWVDLYRQRFPKGSVPTIEFRTMVRDLPPGVKLPDDLPNYQRQPLSMFARLFATWATMGFRRPVIGFVKGQLDGC